MAQTKNHQKAPPENTHHKNSTVHFEASTESVKHARRMIHPEAYPERANHMRRTVCLEDPPENNQLKILILFLIGFAAICLVILVWEVGRTQETVYTVEAAETLPQSQRKLYLDYDKECGVNFISNEVVLIFHEGTPVEQMQEVIHILDGENDGVISDTCYRIWLPKNYTYQELCRICKLLEMKDCVIHAAIDVIQKVSDDKKGAIYL